MGIPLNIDFQQVFLHLLNFLLLTLGLYFLLYSPIVKFMNKREKYYAELDHTAKQKNAEAEQLVQEKNQQMEHLNEELSEMKEKATREAQIKADFYIKEAQKESTKIKERAYQSAIAERQRILENANHEVNDIISKALEQAMIMDEDQIYEQFIKSASEEGESDHES